MKKLIIFIIVAIALITLTLAWLQTNEQMTLQQAEEKIAQAYNADVVTSSKQADAFAITFSNATGQYAATVNTHGQIVALTQTTKIETAPEETPPQEVQPTQPTQLTSEEATRIAITRFAGTVEDIELESSANGGYYDIELESGEQEVNIQIHALTGDILSVVYDD